MKFNWKILVAAVVIVGVMFWAVSSSRPISYTGTNLTFPVKGGLVTVTNPSDAPIAVQLVGNSSRSFSISSSADGLSGSSDRITTGSTSVQMISFDLPAGVSTFTVSRGTDVAFVSQTDTKLQATAEPMSAGDSRMTGIIAIVVAAAALFYMSSATGHGWMKALRGSKPVDPLVVPPPTSDAPVGDPNRGRDGRMYSNYGSKD